MQLQREWRKELTQMLKAETKAAKFESRSRINKIATARKNGKQEE